MIVKDTLKELYFVLLRLIGVQRLLLRRLHARELVVLLNLHRVNPHPNHFWPAMHPRLFEDLLVFLKRHFEVALLRNIPAESSGKPVAVISFDDGYYDFLEYAMPLLAKHRLAANLNVIPACIESGLPPWNIQLYDFLNLAPKSLINEIRPPGFQVLLADTSKSSKLKFGLQISRYLKNRPRVEREELWKGIRPAMEKLSDFQPTRMMKIDDVREAAREHEIGVHSFSHESMGFEDERFFRDDLARCREYFRETLRLPLDIYAFPNGSYRVEQFGILRQAGIKHILLVGEAFAQRATVVYPRLTVYGESRFETRFRALGYHVKKSVVAKWGEIT